VAIGETVLDPSTGPRLSVQLEVPPAPAPVRIILSGELDSEEVVRLQQAVAGLPLPGDRRDLCVEAAELTFVDSAGIRALLTFRERAEDQSARVVIGPVTNNVYRVMEIAGLLDVFMISHPVDAD
jgi:stage II sporulation protein AA (anti-sigma F factor antagonist)